MSMTEEELEAVLSDLYKKIEDMEINLEPPEGSDVSTFTVFEDKQNERQMIVHFVSAEEYNLPPPGSKGDAHTLFLKIIKEHKGNQNHAITHGDLIVLKGVYCNYYCYVAKVDRIGGSGFQDFDTTGAAITEEYGDRIVHELVIWTETYPGGGGGATFDVTAISVTSGTNGSLKLTELIITLQPPIPEVEIDGIKLEPSTPSGDPIKEEKFNVNEVLPGEVTTGETVQNTMQSMTSEPAVSLGSTTFASSHVSLYSPTAEPAFTFDARSIDAIDGTETPSNLYSTQIEITDGKCYGEGDIDADEWDPSPDVLYQAGDIVQKDGQCYEAREDQTIGAWWDSNDGTQPITYNNGTEPVEWCPGTQLPAPSAGDIFFCGNDYVIALIDNARSPAADPPGQLGVDYLEIATPENQVPGDPAAENMWFTIECPRLQGQEIPCPTEEFKMYSATWEEIGSLDQRTFYLGAPELKDYSYGSLDLVTDLTLSEEFKQDGDTDYPELLSGCPEVKVSLSNPANIQNIKVLGGSLPQLTFTEKPDEPEVDISSLVPVRPENRAMMKDVDIGFELDGAPVKQGESLDVISAIESASLTYEAETGSTDFELINKTVKSTSSPVDVPILVQDTTATSCGGCMVMKATGNLSLVTKTYEGTKQTLTIGSQKATLTLNGKKAELSRKLQATLIRKNKTQIKAWDTSKTYELGMDMELYNLTSSKKDISVSIFGTYSNTYEQKEGQQCVSIYKTQNNYTTLDQEFGHSDIKVSIDRREGQWTGEEYDVTSTQKDYEIKVSEREDTLYSKTVTVKLPAGKTVTVTPGVTKIGIDYQRLHKSTDYQTKLNFSDKYTFDLTPYETKLYFSQTHELEIHSEPDYYEFQEAKKLKLIPKEYKFEQYKQDLQYEEKQLDLTGKSVQMAATECQTISITENPLPPNSIDLWSASSTPIPVDPFNLETTRVSIANPVSLGKKLYFDWVDVSLGTPAVSLGIKGVSLGNYGYESAPDPVELDYSTLESEYHGGGHDKTLHHNEITYDVIPYKNDVLIYSVRYSKGEEPSPTPYEIQSTKFDISLNSTKTVRADYLKTEITDLGSDNYDRVKTTKLSLDSTSTEYISTCFDAGVFKKYSDGYPCEDSDYAEIPLVSLSTDYSGTPMSEKLQVPATAWEEQSPNETTHSGADLPLVSIGNVTDSSSEEELFSDEVGSTPTISSTDPETLSEWTEGEVTYNDVSDDGTRLYLPKLSSCPINGDTINVVDDSRSGGSQVSINSTANVLCFSTIIPLKAYSINCGVLSSKTSSSISYKSDLCINLQPYWMHTLNVCNASGDPDTITVMTTTDPSTSSNTVTPSGYTILGPTDP